MKLLTIKKNFFPSSLLAKLYTNRASHYRRRLHRLRDDLDLLDNDRGDADADAFVVFFAGANRRRWSKEGKCFHEWLKHTVAVSSRAFIAKMNRKTIKNIFIDIESAAESLTTLKVFFFFVPGRVYLREKVLGWFLLASRFADLKVVESRSLERCWRLLVENTLSVEPPRRRRRLSVELLERREFALLFGWMRRKFGFSLQWSCIVRV